MAIPRGITTIVGGGFHGKSTLLQAISLGIYNHIPGDGREFVVTDPTAVGVRSEDGRSVSGVDISPFIGDLPGFGRTKIWSSKDASGSTSMAAAVVEVFVPFVEELKCRLVSWAVRSYYLTRICALRIL